MPLTILGQTNNKEKSGGKMKLSDSRRLTYVLVLLITAYTMFSASNSYERGIAALLGLILIGINALTFITMFKDEIEEIEKEEKDGDNNDE